MIFIGVKRIVSIPRKAKSIVQGTATSASLRRLSGVASGMAVIVIVSSRNEPVPDEAGRLVI